MRLAHIGAARARIAAELPAVIEWNLFDAPCILDFTRARRVLQTGTDIVLVGGEPDRCWNDLFLFGEERHDGGASPFYTFMRSTHEVRALDVEADADHVQFVNSTVSQFVASVRALDRVVRLREAERATLATVLHSIDPDGYPRSRWRALVTSLTEGDVAR